MIINRINRIIARGSLQTQPDCTQALYSPMLGVLLLVLASAAAPRCLAESQPGGLWDAAAAAAGEWDEEDGSSALPDGQPGGDGGWVAQRDVLQADQGGASLARMPPPGMATLGVKVVQLFPVIPETKDGRKNHTVILTLWLRRVHEPVHHALPHQQSRSAIRGVAWLDDPADLNYRTFGHLTLVVNHAAWQPALRLETMASEKPIAVHANMEHMHEKRLSDPLRPYHFTFLLPPNAGTCFKVRVCVATHMLVTCWAGIWSLRGHDPHAPGCIHLGNYPPRPLPPAPHLNARACGAAANVHTRVLVVPRPGRHAPSMQRGSGWRCAHPRCHVAPRCTAVAPETCPWGWPVPLGRACVRPCVTHIGGGAQQQQAKSRARIHSRPVAPPGPHSDL